MSKILDTMQELYRTNNDFHEYVDKYARSYGITIRETLLLKIVQSYAEALQER